MHPKKWLFAALMFIAGCWGLAIFCVCVAEVLFMFQPLPASPTEPPASPTFTLLPLPSSTFSPQPTDTLSPTAETDNSTCVSRLAVTLYKSDFTDAPDGKQFDEKYSLVQYSVDGDSILFPITATNVPASLKPFQKDTARQKELWNFVVDVIPPEWRKEVTDFVIYSDGPSGSLGAVRQADNNPHDWMLMLDIVDMGDIPDLSTTVTHELGHLLTLNDTQITIDYQVYNNPDNQNLFDREAAACPTYFLFEGCSQPNSYINTFYQRFWNDIYAEWQTIDAETDPDIRLKKLDDFYLKYHEQFVSAYAVTNPGEDIAESWKYFIFTRKPDGNNILDQKILFFYDYPELVALRNTLIDKLCPYVSQP